MSDGLHDRLREAAGHRSYRHIGELTDTHPETVRRYMQGQAPGIEFITAFVNGLGLSAEWLISGRGPMRAGELKSHHLNHANAPELLNAMANTIEKLITRVERLEVFLNTLEARMRAQSGPAEGVHVAIETKPPADADGRAASVADALADAVARRSPADAG